MRLLPVVALCASTLAQAGIFKTYDKHGNVIFSDTPSADAQPVEDKPVATIPALPRTVIDQKTKPAAAAPGTATASAPASYKLTVENLLPNATLRKEDPALSANIQLQPPLWKEHHLLTTLDGTPVGRDNFAPVIDPGKLDRGQHRLEITIVDAKNAVLGTEVLDFFIQQASVANKKPGKK